MRGRRNPLPSFHPVDRPSYEDLIRRACGCAAKTASRIAEAFPGGLGLDTATSASLRHLGATQAQADRLTASFELARLAMARSVHRHGRVTSPDEAVRYLRRVIAPLEQEQFVVFFLDSRQRIVDVRLVAQGSLASVDIHPRELFRDAIRLRAHSLLLAHNHPSGDHEPSDADVALTHRMSEVGRLVGIPVLDHIVISPSGHTSLAMLGLA